MHGFPVRSRISSDDLRTIRGFTQVGLGSGADDEPFPFSIEQRRAMLANTMMVGQVGLAVAPLYLQTGRLKLVGDTNHGDGPFLEPFEKSILDMWKDLRDKSEEWTSYRLHVVDIMRHYKIDQSGTIPALFRK